MSGSIYTGTGDGGETSLVGGDRVSKSSRRVDAYGAIDEANSAVGLARAASPATEMDSVLEFVQQRLMNIASRLATPSGSTDHSTPSVDHSDVERLEIGIDEYLSLAGDAAGFVLPCGCELASRLHVARATVRRAERRLVALAEEEPVDEEVLRFVNRVSDLLFAAARAANASEGPGDRCWDPEAK